MAQTIKPAPHQLFCKPDEAITQTKSGILLDTKSAEKPKTAQVINRGDAVEDYRAKDTVIYKPYSITEIKLDGVEYFLVDEADILGTIVETK